jgi:hypothetical protein
MHSGTYGIRHRRPTQTIMPPLPPHTGGFYPIVFGHPWHAAKTGEGRLLSAPGGGGGQCSAERKPYKKG